MKEELAWQAFSIKDRKSFDETALKIFRLQSERNPVYRDFVKNLGIMPESISRIEEIPFLPVELFKTRKVILEEAEPERIFESSRTTGGLPSRHFIHDTTIYERSFTDTFRIFYGDPSDYMIAALLPSYTERENSSLVFMTGSLIRQSGDPGSGFFMNGRKDLPEKIKNARKKGRKILLLGVSFALLDMAEEFPCNLEGVIVMETGGMKGRRKEITRDELHSILKSRFNVPSIHSEYGMTELLSQAYSEGNGLFQTPPWMKVMIRDPHDPLTVASEQPCAGGINVIDLANYYSCPFIATGDYGILHPGGSFEITGRIDNSDVRGCSLMIAGI